MTTWYTVPPEWVVPDGKDSHVTQAMISACLEGDVRSFEQLRKTSAITLVPPGLYLKRCAVRSRELVMVKHIWKRFAREGLAYLPVDSPIRKNATEHRQTHGQYAVFLAIIQGDVAIVEYLLKQGESMFVWDSSKYWSVWTLLEVAIHENQVDVARLLLRRGAKPSCDTGSFTRPFLTCMDLAAAIGTPVMVDLLLEYRGKIQTPNILWRMAASSHCTDNAQTLLELGININEIRTTWGTALHAAAHIFHPEQEDERLDEGKIC